ncbi:hypothetical protein WJX79_006669 [Trebouxia sp. C0005]
MVASNDVLQGSVRQTYSVRWQDCNRADLSKLQSHQLEPSRVSWSDSELDIGESSQRAPQLPTPVTHHGIASARDWSEDEEEAEAEFEIEVEVGVQVQIRAHGRHEARPRVRPSTVRRPSRQRRGVKRQSHAATAASSSESEDTSSSSDDGIDHDGGSDSDCSYCPPTACNLERSNDDDSPATSTDDEASGSNSEGFDEQLLMSPDNSLHMATDAEQLPSRHSRQHHKNNFLIHQLFLRQDLDECLSLIEASLADSQGVAEYALYIKALIHRQKGQLSESLQLFQQAAVVSPNNLTYHKQVGRTLLLLGSFEAALQVFEEAVQLAPRDWELWHNKGACYMAAKKYDWAAENFVKANSIEQHDSTFLQLGKDHHDMDVALVKYHVAAVQTPNSPQLWNNIGMCFFYKQKYVAAISCLKKASYLGSTMLSL